MNSTYRYFKLTIKHKWFVFLAGLKVGCPIWRLIKHDWTKFLPSELPYYGRRFYPDERYANIDSLVILEWAHCWLRHQNRNDHHWEYWITRSGVESDCCSFGSEFDDNQPLDMTDDAIKEMVADWIGASRAYEGKWPKKGEWDWFNNNFDKIRITTTTRIIIKNILDDYFKVINKEKEK